MRDRPPPRRPSSTGPAASCRNGPSRSRARSAAARAAAARARAAGQAQPGKRERLQKVMAQSGHGSRRNIEILIAQGHITINGQVAKLGDSVGPGDRVKLDGSLIQPALRRAAARACCSTTSPRARSCTRDDPERRAHRLRQAARRCNGGRWVSVGRLDFNTGGLLSSPPTASSPTSSCTRASRSSASTPCA